MTSKRVYNGKLGNKRIKWVAAQMGRNTNRRGESYEETRNKTLQDTSKMATRVYKKLEERTVHRIICAIQEDEGLLLSWKSGPYMRNTKVNKVSITHWPNKGTLMLQGPDMETNQLNEKIQRILDNNEGQDQQRNAIINQRGDVFPEMQIEWQQGSSTNENYTMENTPITRTQIEDLLRFIRRWENTGAYVEEAREGSGSRRDELQIVQRQHEEAAHVMRENRAITRFKYEILTYMQQNGLVQGKGKGKKGCARNPVQWASGSDEQIRIHQ